MRIPAKSRAHPRSASPDPSPARSPPPRAEKPLNSGTEPPSYFHGTPRPALSAPLARPEHLRDGRRERLLRRGADQQRLEKCQSQGQQAASSHLRDRRSISLPSPAGGRTGAGNRGRRRSRVRPDHRRPRAGAAEAVAGARAGVGVPQGLSPARGKGRRADPLARVGSAAPQLPRLSRHQGRLWKQTWASPPALARSRSLSVSSLIYSPDCRGAGGGRRRGRRRADGTGEGGGGCRDGGMAGGETCGREGGFVWLLRASQRGVAGGGQREGWASEHSGGDGQERPSIQGRKELPKSAPASSRRPACGARAGRAPRTSQGTASRPGGVHRQPGLRPSTWLASSGVIFPRQAVFPRPFSQAQNPLPA